MSGRKNPAKKWNELPYLATDDVIFTILELWQSKWRAPAMSTLETKKPATQWKKEEEKLRMVQLADKRSKKAATEKA